VFADKRKLTYRYTVHRRKTNSSNSNEFFYLGVKRNMGSSKRV